MPLGPNELLIYDYNWNAMTILACRNIQLPIYDEWQIPVWLAKVRDLPLYSEAHSSGNNGKSSHGSLALSNLYVNKSHISAFWNTWVGIECKKSWTRSNFLLYKEIGTISVSKTLLYHVEPNLSY